MWVVADHSLAVHSWQPAPTLPIPNVYAAGEIMAGNILSKGYAAQRGRLHLAGRGGEEPVAPLVSPLHVLRVLAVLRRDVGGGGL